jgi:hypothetical protein
MRIFIDPPESLAYGPLGPTYWCICVDPPGTLAYGPPPPPLPQGRCLTFVWHCFVFVLFFCERRLEPQPHIYIHTYTYIYIYTYSPFDVNSCIRGLIVDFGMVRSHFGSSFLQPFVLVSCRPGRMVSFSQPRLEGRALEHALAGFGGDGVRMRDDAAGEWGLVRDARAKAAMAYMRIRADTLRGELASAGLLVQGADRAVRVHGDDLSVDVRVWAKDHGTEALLEMKWTRQSLSVAMRQGLKKLPMLREASTHGKWLQKNGKPGKVVQAGAVGVLAVGPSSWRCSLECAKGTWEATYPPLAPPPPKPPRSGRHKAGAKKASGRHKPGVPRASGRHPRGLKRPSSGLSGSQSSGSQRRFNELPPAKRRAA